MNKRERENVLPKMCSTGLLYSLLCVSKREREREREREHQNSFNHFPKLLFSILGFKIQAAAAQNSKLQRRLAGEFFVNFVIYRKDKIS